MHGQWWYSFVLAPFGLAGMVMAGRRVAWGWALSVFTQVLWILYALAIQQYGMIIGSTAYLVVYVRNFLAWRREKAGTA